jgi:uncharacterized membrane-anchored protein
MNPFEQENPGFPTSNNDKPLSVKDWVITLILVAIPLVGFIMLLIWAFDDNGNIHKKNFAKGSLVVMLIMIVISIFFYVTIFAAFIGTMSNMSSYQ